MLEHKFTIDCRVQRRAIGKQIVKSKQNYTGDYCGNVK